MAMRPSSPASAARLNALETEAVRLSAGLAQVCYDLHCAGGDATAGAAREKALADVVSALVADVVALRADN